MDVHLCVQSVLGAGCIQGEKRRGDLRVQELVTCSVLHKPLKSLNLKAKSAKSG